MNPLPVVALAAVSDDVQLAYDYFETRVARTGDKFLARYFEVTDRIAANAEAYPIKFDDYRRALVPKSNVAIYYFIEPDRVVLVAAVDARRNPRLIRELVRGRK